jgi:formylglycine-generating enzyme required for sulfatase activity/class 3 adenylate cyclase
MPSGDVSLRRLEAILCGDIVGYSKHMSYDEEGTLARVMHHRREIIEPTIAEHHGRVIKWLGDGFLAMFDSPLEAVRCAIVIQQAVAVRNTSLVAINRLEYRMGVNLGDVIIKDDDVYGDGVNVAARLQTSAAPGTVNISGGIYEQVKNKLVVGYQSLGDEKLKNITDPVRIYRVLPDPAAVRTYSRRKIWIGSTAAAVALMAIGGGLTYWGMRERSPVAATQIATAPRPPPVAAPIQTPSASPPAPSSAVQVPPSPSPLQPIMPLESQPDARVAAVPAPAPTPPPQTRQEGRDCQGCPEMVDIPSGTFRMGSGDDSSEKPVHSVSVKAFAISRYPITVKEWRQCYAANVCKFEPIAIDSEPMRNVSFNDVQDYIAWLSKVTDQPYRLPSEAEWEYAARAGSTTPFWWGRQMVAGVANCKACGGPPELLPVGRFAPNNWGLHDMVGSVAQWTQDCWHRDYTGAPKDGSAWEAHNCRERVLRGASWMSNDPFDIRVTYRAYYDAAVRYPAHGFRVVRSAKTGGR